MILKKLLLISFILFLSCKKYDGLASHSKDTAYNIIETDSSSVRSFFGINEATSWADIAKIFDVDEENMRKSVLRKSIKINDREAELVVFVGDNNVEQVSIIMPSDMGAKTFSDEVLSQVSKIGVEPYVTILENDDGSALEKTQTYLFDNSSFFITFGENELSLSMSYAKQNSFE